MQVLFVVLITSRTRILHQERLRPITSSLMEVSTLSIIREVV